MRCNQTVIKSTLQNYSHTLNPSTNDVLQTQATQPIPKEAWNVSWPGSVRS